MTTPEPFAAVVARLADKLIGYTVDYDGRDIPDNAEPLDGLHCGLLREAAACLADLTARAEAAERGRDRAEGEIVGMCDVLAHWKFHAIWARCKMTGRDPDDAASYTAAEAELEKARADENRERYSHAEPPREIGS